MPLFLSSLTATVYTHVHLNVYVLYKTILYAVCGFSVSLFFFFFSSFLYPSLLSCYNETYHLKRWCGEVCVFKTTLAIEWNAVRQALYRRSRSRRAMPATETTQWQLYVYTIWQQKTSPSVSLSGKPCKTINGPPTTFSPLQQPSVFSVEKLTNRYIKAIIEKKRTKRENKTKEKRMKERKKRKKRERKKTRQSERRETE